MEGQCKQVAVLGSTGSIGRQALEVIAEQPGLRACALGAASSWQLLAQQAEAHGPRYVALADGRAGEKLKARLPAGVELLCGPEAMSELVRMARPQVLLCGMAGSSGLAPTLAGIDCGCNLAIANKETLVMAGAVVMPAARRAGVAVLPVDSEHSAIFQCLSAGRREEVRRVTITASGGALRDWNVRDVQNATVEQALQHPTWSMGKKITIDSATMMNKALELVEAHWLFGLPAEQLQVVLHPESIVHSYVEFHDGSVIAQLARPDMKTPIAYALCHPDRPARDVARLDLPAIGRLTFSALEERFQRAVELGYRAIRRGGLTGAVLSSANEAAVEAFLDGRIPFGRIVPLVEQVLDSAPVVGMAPAGERQHGHANSSVAMPPAVNLEELMQADAWARREVQRLIGSPQPTAQANEQ